MSFSSILGSVTGGALLGMLTPNNPNYGGASATLNKKNQQQIDQGLQAINATYFGGSYPSYSKVAGGAKYDPSLSYSSYNVNKGYSPVTPKYGKNGKIRGAGKLFQTTTSPYQTGFTPAFYQGVQNDYIQAAMPQLAQQQKQAQNSISYGLFNKGLTPGSSAYADAMSQLNQTTGQAEQQVANNAVSAANNTQQNVMNSYQNAINQLYQTGNPSQAAQGAVSQASQLKVPQAFTPIANMFSGLANDYATSLLYNYTPGGGSSYAPSGGGTGGTGFLGSTANYGD